MGLIESTRYTARDLEVWRRLERFDRLLANSTRTTGLVERALETISEFEPDYIGVSWGKDSVVAAHLALEVWPQVPLVWVRVDDWENPDCPLVRDAFLASHPGATYDEITAVAGTNRAGGTSKLGFAEAKRRYGPRYISGVRADESGTRKIRARRWGTTSTNTCAPLCWWTSVDVFAAIARWDLPAHPAYACSMGGMKDRQHLRVGSLGGERGTGHGRAEWEQRYYPRQPAPGGWETNHKSNHK